MLYTTRINIYTHNINARNKHACDNIKSEYYERIKSIVSVSMFDSYSKVTKKRLKFISTTENNKKKYLKKKKDINGSTF